MAAIQSLRRVFTAFQRALASHPTDGIPASDLLVLHHIAHAGQTTPGGLAAATGLTTGSVTGLLDRLERGGLVQRDRDRLDRRVVHVRLRPEAHARIEAVMDEVHRRVGAIFHGWDPERIGALAALLGDLHVEGLGPTRPAP